MHWRERACQYAPLRPPKLIPFHSAEDQRRVVNAISLKRIPDEDLSLALRAPPELPKDIAPSQAAPLPPAAPTTSWAPSRPKTNSLIVARKPRPSSSASSAAPPSSSRTSSQVVDLTSSPVKTAAPSSSTSRLPSSSQSQVIDISSSPVKDSGAVHDHTQASTEASGSTAQPATVAEGRVVRAEREEDQDESEGSPEPEDDVFYLRHQDDVVGIQHYGGLVGVGERVVLVSDCSQTNDEGRLTLTLRM